MAGRRKSLLKKLEVQVAGKQRACRNTRSVIRKGDSCLVVWDSQYDRHTYSRSVALDMIADAREALDALESSL